MEVGEDVTKNAEAVLALTERVGNLQSALISLAGITSMLALAIDGKLTPKQLSGLQDEAARIMAKVGARLETGG